MGNVLIDLDQRFGKFQFTYLEVYKKQDYKTAASILYQANCNLPLEARVTDMPQYKKIGKKFRDELVENQRAFDYCEIWSGIVWSSIADYCTEMLNKLQD